MPVSTTTTTVTRGSVPYKDPFEHTVFPSRGGFVLYEFDIVIGFHADSDSEEEPHTKKKSKTKKRKADSSDDSNEEKRKKQKAKKKKSKHHSKSKKLKSNHFVNLIH